MQEEAGELLERSELERLEEVHALQKGESSHVSEYMIRFLLYVRLLYIVNTIKL